MLSFKGMRFPNEVTLICIRWYVAYPMNYRLIADIIKSLSLRRKRRRFIPKKHYNINR